MSKVDYCKVTFDVLATFAGILDSTLKDASQEDKLKSICIICESLLTAYLADLDEKDRKQWLDFVYQGALNGELLDPPNSEK